jgi:hypothetical protein
MLVISSFQHNRMLEHYLGQVNRVNTLWGKRCLKSIAPRWVFSLQDLGLALVSSVILLVLISKVPPSVAAICGVPVGGAGDWGISTLFAGAEMGAQAAALASNFGGAALASSRMIPHWKT